ncbi:hypothetical protein GQ55_9G091600 [Panicum hallii var. hallii]|uniref:Uncharacterized protein n=1 Tax=Panicum hallii var. hallii TaxID=1504633 RepID=A0A2T7C191_9POAL|nr:hypothetical protein GQ55_9G091600 [Panicum hallii var. hallii]
MERSAGSNSEKLETVERRLETTHARQRRRRVGSVVRNGVGEASSVAWRGRCSCCSQWRASSSEPGCPGDWSQAGRPWALSAGSKDAEAGSGRNAGDAPVRRESKQRKRRCVEILPRSGVGVDGISLTVHPLSPWWPSD